MTQTSTKKTTLVSFRGLPYYVDQDFKVFYANHNCHSGCYFPGSEITDRTRCNEIIANHRRVEAEAYNKRVALAHKSDPRLRKSDTIY